MRPETGDLKHRRPIVCLVTARRRLCPECDDEGARACLAQQIRQAVTAGIDLVQIRERDLAAAPLVALVAEAVAAARGSVTRIIVNDRLDVALAAAADGVHLRGDSMPSAAARRLAPAGFLIGRSVRHADEAVTAGADVDYVIAGTVFPSASKAEATPKLGEAGLAAIARAAPVPVLAIGGVTLEVVPRVAAAGAAGFAAIGAFLGETLPCRSIPLSKIVEEARARFDSVKRAP